jgi:hypothetical protein
MPPFDGIGALQVFTGCLATASNSGICAVVNLFLAPLAH